MNNREGKLEALKELGIRTEKDLAEAIKAQKPINISLMTCPMEGREGKSSQPA